MPTPVSTLVFKEISQIDAQRLDIYLTAAVFGLALSGIITLAKEYKVKRREKAQNRNSHSASKRHPS